MTISKLITLAITSLCIQTHATPHIHIIGDSTASNGKDLGWGSHFAAFFNPDKVTVHNRARGGRSSRTFLTEGLWEKVKGDLKRGDFVLIQFGHNDGGKPGEGKDRGSLDGTGEETVQVKNETVHTFGWYLRKYVAETRAKKAVPVILSLTVRNEWKDGKVERGPGSFSRWAEEVAKSEKTAFVDLNNIIGATYERKGREAVKPFFPKDHTHTSPEGAALNARLVVAGLKALPGQPFDTLLSSAGDAVAPDAAGRQQPFPTPGQLTPNHNPELPTVFFIGDSTVKNGRDVGSDGLWGWAHPVASRFDRSRINVENEALGGTSTRTYRSGGHWENVLKFIDDGDYVVMQFGHNDGSPVNDTKRARGTFPDNSDRTEEITNLVTGEKEFVHSYGWYLRQLVAEAREKGAHPVVCSPVPRHSWDKGEVRRGEKNYAHAAKEVAEQTGVPFIDLNTLVADHYDQLGEEAVGSYFPVDHTHTGWDGAVFNADAFAKALRKTEPKCGLADYLE